MNGCLVLRLVVCVSRPVGGIYQWGTALRLGCEDKRLRVTV